MPVPTPRTIQIIDTEEDPPPSYCEEDYIPDDWKDVGEIIPIKRGSADQLSNNSDPMRRDQLPAVDPSQPIRKGSTDPISSEKTSYWPIPEVPEDEINQNSIQPETSQFKDSIVETEETSKEVLNETKTNLKVEKLNNEDLNQSIEIQEQTIDIEDPIIFDSSADSQEPIGIDPIIFDSSADSREPIGIKEQETTRDSLQPISITPETAEIKEPITSESLPLAKKAADVFENKTADDQIEKSDSKQETIQSNVDFNGAESRFDKEYSLEKSQIAEPKRSEVKFDSFVIEHELENDDREEIAEKYPDIKQTLDDQIEFNVKDMKKFWEVAAANLEEHLSLKSNWTSMPNLAKNMATQTTVSYESSEDESEDSEDDYSDTKETSTPQDKLLLPIEERKKAFITDNNNKAKIASPWKSMPSLNKTSQILTSTPNPPLPLVGACYPSKKDEIQFEQPIKQIKEVFEPAPAARLASTKLLLPVDYHQHQQSRRRSSSVSSVSSLSNPSSNNEADENTPKSESTNQNSPVVYRWNDESNGEIYTDRQTTSIASIENINTFQGEDEETTDSSLGLYVVENGKEYPLIPLKDRKSVFESQSVKVSYKLATSTTIKEKTKGLNEIMNQSTVVSDRVIRRPFMIDSVGNPDRNQLRRDPPVKSSIVPYIQEEKDILENINLVSKIKPKFGYTK